jgi:O-antigen ligase
LTAREGYWQLALPISTASARNFFFGVGSGALEAPALSAHAVTNADVAVTPQVFQNSLHNQYVTTLLELGVVGLAALALFLGSVAVPAARFARASGDRFVAGLTASTVAVAIIMTVDTALLDAPSCAMILTAAGLAALGDPRSLGPRVSDRGTSLGGLLRVRHGR